MGMISMSSAVYRYLEMRAGKYAQTGDFFQNSGKSQLRSDSDQEMEDRP